MPCFIEHCKHTLDRYGVDGASMHRWMDEPATIVGRSHRKFRHDPNGKIPPFLVEEYGETLARNILLDHLHLDKTSPDGKYLNVDTSQSKLYEKIRVLDKDVDEIKQTLKIKPIEILEGQIQKLSEDVELWKARLDQLELEGARQEENLSPRAKFIREIELVDARLTRCEIKRDVEVINNEKKR